MGCPSSRRRSASPVAPCLRARSISTLTASSSDENGRKLATAKRTRSDEGGEDMDAIGCRRSESGAGRGRAQRTDKTAHPRTHIHAHATVDESRGGGTEQKERRSRRTALPDWTRPRIHIFKGKGPRLAEAHHCFVAARQRQKPEQIRRASGVGLSSASRGGAHVEERRVCKQPPEESEETPAGRNCQLAG